MRKLRWLLAATAGVALLGAVAAQAVAASPEGTGPATILTFDKMAPVTGPYVGSANPVRGLAGGGLPWMITSATGSLRQDGHVLVIVRGLVLADAPPVPAALRGTNPVPDFRAIVSCQAIGAGSTATVENVSTGTFPADMAGNSKIDATVTLPRPCIAPVIFVTAPNSAWFAATGS